MYLLNALVKTSLSALASGRGCLSLGLSNATLRAVFPTQRSAQGAAEMGLSAYAQQLGAFVTLVAVQSTAILLFKLCQVCVWGVVVGGVLGSV